MAQTLKRIELKDVYDSANPVTQAPPPSVKLSRKETSLANELQASTHTFGPHRVTLARATNEEAKQQISSLCAKQNTDCILIHGQRIYIEGQSSAMKIVRYNMGNQINCDGNYIDVPANMDVNAVATSLANQYHDAALWKIATTAGLYDYGRTTIAYLPYEMKPHAADVAKVVHKTDVKNPILMCGNQGGRMYVFMNAASQEGQIMAAKYKQSLQQNVAPGVNAFVFDGDRVEDFLNDANKAGQIVYEKRQNEAVKELQIDMLIKLRGIRNYEGIAATYLPIASSDAPKALQQATNCSSNKNVFVAYKNGNRFEVTFNANTPVGERMTGLYESNGRSSHSPDTTVLRFDTKDEVNAFIRDANAQALAIAQGMNQRQLNDVHTAVTNAISCDKTYVIAVSEGQCNAYGVQTTMDKFVQNPIVMEYTKNGTNVFVSAKSSLGRYLANHVMSPTALGVDANTFHFKSPDEAQKFIDTANQFLERQQQHSDIAMDDIDMDEIEVE